MSSSDRRTILLALAALPLAGCGFTPVYGTGGSAEALRGRVRAADPDDHNGYVYIGRLEERLGRPEAPIFDLSYTISTSEEGLAISSGGETTRYNVTGTARFTLTDRRSGQSVLTGSVDSFTAYSATGTTVSTLSAKRAAYDRLMVILADQTITRLLASAATLPA